MMFSDGLKHSFINILIYCGQWFSGSELSRDQDCISTFIPAVLSGFNF